MNVITKFKRFYGRLDSTEQRHLYDLLSLLRGPDFNDEYANIKIATTMKIRYMLGINGAIFKPSGEFPHYRHTCPAIDACPIVPEVINKLLADSDDTHFVEHAQDALATLYELGILKEPVHESSGVDPTERDTNRPMYKNGPP